MSNCSLNYIPDRLKRNNRPIINKFEIGEFLYMRCPPESLSNPYRSISITELSHNRSGLKSEILCNPEDVLFSILEKEHFEKYANKEICTLEIVSLNESNNYRKTFKEEKESIEFEGILELLHEPEQCMYPHSVFRVWLNNEIVTYDNHKNTLGKQTKIRNRIKEELASMIIQRRVSQEN